MYEEYFGLKSNPFRSNAEGAAVFVGPTQTKVISRIHKALAAADNIVTVSGPVGVGKTTIVTRALETNKRNQMVAWIGRMRLAPDEVMQLLLAGFGITKQVPGTVRQFAVFQRMLAERAAADTRVVIVVEDTLRIGTEALLELEAITAADSGNVGGANIILMGPPEIDKRMSFPELARLRQRSRMAQKIAALSFAEVQGYLKHSLRVAGREYTDIFDDDVGPMLYRLSEGVPRVMNNICDAALTAAEEGSKERISSQLVVNVAADVYALEPVLEDPSLADTIETAEPVAEKLVDIDPLPEPVVETDPEPEPELEPVVATQPEPEPEPDPVPVARFVAEPDPVPVTITTPDPELPPIVAAALAQEEEEITEEPPAIAITGLQPELEPDSFNDTADDLPMLSNSMRIDAPIKPAPISTEDESPVTLEESPGRKRAMPDLDALEAAITAARGDERPFDKTDTQLPELNFAPAEPVIETVVAVDPEPIPEPEPELIFEDTPVFEDKPVATADAVVEIPAAAVPEITLEKSIGQSLEDQRAEGGKLDEMATELASADSLEDMSDRMAETLFGIEFEQIAQEALKNPPAAGTLPGETDVLAEPALADPDESNPANDPGEVPSPVMLEPEPVETVGMAEEEVREEHVVMSTGEYEMPNIPTAANVDSIEDQFKTEITQTMKTIDPANLPNPEIPEEEEKPSGLFGRLKKTFKG